MKKILISLIVMVLFFPTFSFADNDVISARGDGEEKLDNMKNSNIDDMLEFDPGTANEDHTLSDGITDFERNLDSWWRVFSRTILKYSKIIVLIVSVFSLFLYILFRALRVKSLQKAAVFMTIMPTVVYIIYAYLSPFLSTLE